MDYHAHSPSDAGGRGIFHLGLQFKTTSRGVSCYSADLGNMYILLSLFLVILHLLVLPIYLYLTWNHKYWSKRGLTTARPLTVLGTYPGLLTRKSNLVIDIQKIYE